jgi:MFS family permease
MTTYGIGFWLPQMLKAASGSGNFVVGLLTAIPYGVATVAMVIVGQHSDRSGERRWHFTGPAIVCAASLVASTLSSNGVWTVAMLSVAMAAASSMLGPFWALATSEVAGVGAAASIALVNSVGNTGGFLGPYLLGAINDATHSFAAALLTIAAMLVVGGALALRIRDGA